MHPELVGGKVPNPAGHSLEMSKACLDHRLEEEEKKRKLNDVFERALTRVAKKRIDAAVAVKESRERFEEQERKRRETRRAADRAETMQGLMNQIEKMAKTTLEEVNKSQEEQAKIVEATLMKQNEELAAV